MSFGQYTVDKENARIFMDFTGEKSFNKACRAIRKKYGITNVEDPRAHLIQNMFDELKTKLNGDAEFLALVSAFVLHSVRIHDHYPKFYDQMRIKIFRLMKESKKNFPLPTEEDN